MSDFIRQCTNLQLDADRLSLVLDCGEQDTHRLIRRLLLKAHGGYEDGVEEQTVRRVLAHDQANVLVFGVFES